MRVLIGYLINGKSSGIDKYVLRILDTLQDQKIQFDCLTTEKTEELEEVMRPYGVKLIECPTLKTPLKQYQFFRNLIEKQLYDEVYINISEAFNSLAAFAAHRCHVRRIVIHSHNTQVGGGSTKVRWVRKLLHMVFRPLVKQIATDCCACSDDAGRWMFTGAYQVIPNAVDSSLFVYDERVRERVRKALQLDGKLVVGHVGSYNYAKNNFFLIDIMRELAARRPDAVLLSVGIGEDLDAVRKKAAEAGVADKIQFLGIRTDVNQLMQAMDCFVLPSRFEGQPIVAIEAQTAGLPTLISDTITKEALLTEYCYQLPIHKGAAVWAEAIDRHASDQRINVLECPLKSDKYDIKRQRQQIRSLFEMSV